MRFDRHAFVQGTIALALLLTAAPAAAAQRAGTDIPTYPITACNEHAETVALALAYKRAEDMDNDDWYYRGWLVLTPGKCHTVARSASRYFYHYATELDNAKVVWDGDINLCIQYPGPYGFPLARSAPSCPAKTEVAPFSENFIAPGVDGFQLKFD